MNFAQLLSTKLLDYHSLLSDFFDELFCALILRQGVKTVAHLSGDIRYK